MKIENNTRNQHFLSQTEQRLNAINPNANNKNQRIHSFNIVDRDNFKLSPPLSDKGVLIYNNLSFDDLFSFDVVDNSIRANLEALFQTYERNIEEHTTALLNKLKLKNHDINDDLINLFACKYMSALRNPNCIEKTINTFSILSAYEFTDTELINICKRIENGIKPQQKYLCAQLGITNQMYRKWLMILFMLLGRPKSPERNLFESNIKSLFEKSHYTQVFVFNYLDEHLTKGVLLSDRGFNTPIENEGCSAFTFNLCRNAFINYIFLDLKKQTLFEFPKWRIDLFTKTNLKNIDVTYIENNLEALSSYNKNTLYQAKDKVYCSNKFVYGLDLMQPVGPISEA